MTNQVIQTLDLPDGRVVRAVSGDITDEDVDAIVNAANERLAHGGGVAGAISRKGGPAIQEESDRWISERGRVPTGNAAITSGGSLKARYVIHTVGPVWNDSGDEDDLLRRAITSALLMADEHGVASISIPAVSTGIYGFPKERAAPIIVDAVLDYLDSHGESPLREVRLCDRDARSVDLLADELRKRA